MFEANKGLRQKLLINFLYKDTAADSNLQETAIATGNSPQPKSIKSRKRLRIQTRVDAV